MNPDSNRSAVTPGPEDPLEPLDRLLGHCLEQPDGEQSNALERICCEHPEHAERLRKRFDLLANAGLLESAPSEPDS